MNFLRLRKAVDMVRVNGYISDSEAEDLFECINTKETLEQLGK